MKSTTIIAGSLVAASQMFGALAVSHDKLMHVAGRVVPREDKAVQKPKDTPVPGSMTSQGCWESRGNFTTAKMKASVVSSGSCQEYCNENDFTVMGLSGQQCLCGNVYPEKDTLSKDSNCNYGCPAYPLEACGGLGNPGYVSVFNLGTEVNVGNYVEEDKDKDEDEDEDKDDDKTSASSTAAGPTSTSPSDNAEETAAETSAPAEEEKKKDEGGGVNVAGVVAGCVAGVVAVAAGAGAAWFFMRRRRNTEIEEEHRRNAAVNAFISGSKPPGSSGSISMTDSRLDPVMGHRRLSNGSIDDNQDYSRKILRVTNA